VPRETEGPKVGKKKKPSNKKPNSRTFRDYFLKHLEFVKEDNELDGEMDRAFFVDSELFLQPEATTDLPEYFKRAGLDYTAPGHWQYLLIALTNAVHREHAGRKPTTPEEEKRFRRGIVMLKLKNPPAKGRELCRMWAEMEQAIGRHPADPESLRTTWLQPLLKKARERVANGTASKEERRFVQALAEIKCRKRQD
jgi:hypothetical protein